MFLLERRAEEEVNWNFSIPPLWPTLLCVNLNEVIPCEMGQAGQKLTQSKSLSFDAELKMFFFADSASEEGILFF